MNIQIRFQSKSGNTKKVAEALGTVLGVVPERLTPLNEKVDLLFIGGGIYAGGIHKALRKYIDRLDKDLIKEVVVFGTSASPSNTNDKLISYLRERGFSVRDENFHCQGRFLFTLRQKPDAEDLAKAGEFAKQFIQ